MTQASYGPLHIYDVPGVLAGQAARGQLSAGSVKDTLLDPDRLSPSERVPLSEQIAGGGNRLTKTLAAVATNPFIWLFFLTGPVGARALQEGKSLFAVQKAYAAQTKKSLGVLSWLRSGLEEFRGTAANTVALETADEVRLLGEKYRAMTVGAEAGLLGRFDAMLGRKGNWAKAALDPSSYAAGTAEGKLVRRWNDLAFAHAHRLDEAEETLLVKTRMRFKVRVGEGKWQKPVSGPLAGQEGLWYEALAQAKTRQDKLKEVLRTKWGAMGEAGREQWGTWENYWGKNGLHISGVDQKVLRRMVEGQGPLVRREWLAGGLAEFGPEGSAYLTAAHKARQRAFVDYIGDEAAFAADGAFVVDRDKAARLASALNREMHAEDASPLGVLHSGATSLQGKEAVLSVVGVDRFERLRGVRDLKQRTDGLVEALADVVTPGSWGSGRWASRNTYRTASVTVGGRVTSPPLGLDQVQKSNLVEVPWAASSAASKHVLPVTEKERLIAPEFLERVRDGLTSAGRDHIAEVRAKAQRAWARDGRGVMVLDADYAGMHRRYGASLRAGTAYDTRAASEAMLRADAEAVKNVAEVARTRTTAPAGRLGTRVDADLTGLPEAERRLVSPGDLMDRVFQQQQSPGHKDMVRHVLVPGALNNAGDEYLAVYNANLRNKELAGAFARSPVGRIIGKMGPVGKGFIERMEEYGDPLSPRVPGSFSDGLAKWFYASHLGANLGSMVLNLTQPLLLASTVAKPGEVLTAYAKAVGEMLDYGAKRVSAGKLFLDPAERLDLMKKSFRFMGSGSGGRNVLGIGPDMHALMDARLMGKGTVADRTFGVLMAGFEKTEWLNRNVAAHLYEAAAKRGGATPVTFLDDLHQFVLQTQFGQDELNTPRLFLKGPMANPLLRQFMSFPLRSLVGAVDVFPRLGGEDYATGLYKTFARGMGLSALVYELGKGLLDADLSRGLFASSVSDLVTGGGRIAEKGGQVLPLPPVLSLPVQFIQGFASEDAGLIGQSFARAVPGGVALLRGAGLLPRLPQTGLAGLPGTLQKTYVGWEERLPSGEVPVYKMDGSLVGYRTAADLYARGLGVDMGRFQNAAAFDNYLVKQRDVILQYRHAVLAAFAGNDLARADSLQAEFRKKYGVPLTVTAQQMKRFVKSGEQGRTERVLDRMPPEVREQFAQAAPPLPDLPGGVTPGAASQRPRLRRQGPGMEERLRELEGRVGPASTSAFTSFAQ